MFFEELNRSGAELWLNFWEGDRVFQGSNKQMAS